MSNSDDNRLFAYMLSQVLRAGDTRLLPTVEELPDNYAALVGQIISTCAQVEWLVKASCYPLLGLTSKEGRVAVRDPRLEDHISMIQQLLSLRNLKVTADLPAIQQTLRELVSERDLLAHGVWFEDEKGNLFVQDIAGTWKPDPREAKVSRRIKPEGVLMTSTTLQQTLAKMRAAYERVDEMHNEIVRVAASSPRRWPPQSPSGSPPSGSK